MGFDVREFVVIMWEFLLGEEVVDKEMRGLGEIFVGEELEDLGVGMMERMNGGAECHNRSGIKFKLVTIRDERKENVQ